MFLFGATLIGRLFYLQILNGEAYQSNYNLKLEKTETLPATRGNIYDRNGVLLAYNELVYSITIMDTGNYKSKAQRSETLNTMIADVIENIELRGDKPDNSFGIYIDSAGQFQFYSSGTTLQRFRADVFGVNSIDDLTFDEELGIDQTTATADQIMEYLEGPKMYNVSDKLSKKLRYEVAVVRYNMGQTSYQKYLSTTIASDVSEKSVAFIKENINELIGIDIEEKSLRRYTDSEYFAHIIGYTGQISTDEYNEMSKYDSTVETTDVVGKSGIEKYMNSQLNGKKGYSTIYVDSVGNTIAQGDYVAAVSGNDVYLSIDYDLTKATYSLLEQEIAGIVYSKIANIKEYKSGANSSASDILIPIYDVYVSLIDNALIDTNAFKDSGASDTEKQVLNTFNNRKKDVLRELRKQLAYDNTTPYNELSIEYQQYSTYLVSKLKSTGIFNTQAITADSQIQDKWTSEELPVNEYLIYAIEQNWIDITKYIKEIKYADTEELYSDLVDYIIDYLNNDIAFDKIIYKYLIINDEISGRELCIILFDQDVLLADPENYERLVTSQITAYDFLKQKIKSLEITPAQLALDPCSGSSVITDVNTGELLALVTYPGYDNNKMANSVNASYYAYISQLGSNPQYNNATQQRTAPGSTFKIVSATAGMAENVIDASEKINDLGVYEKISNKPKCWIYPRGTHGYINVSEAIRHSCNYYFYEVGHRLAGNENYVDSVGISKIAKYASLYGLNEKTGIEIEENEPHIATEYPVMAAIGQSDNNYTTVSLARYVTAIANKGTVYNLTLLDSIRDSEGNIIQSYAPEVRNEIDVLNSAEWDAIHTGMRMVCENLSTFKDFNVNVAGKTGTAQQVLSRPNHALFIGFAPYEDPDIAIATRIAYGYTSHNAADVSKDILAYKFGVDTTSDILNGQASEVDDSQNEFTD
ncbi:MAG: peptidoglycan glycosyltransferase [Pseudobutyrivibrio sp.]|nr:peptidoglycan glycosyltransferase [Pseudobutyrivibrio sp.]